MAKSLGELTDEELIAEFQNDNEAAFTELVQRFKDPLTNFTYRFMGDWDDCHDVVQETFVRVARNLHAFEGRARFTTWLYTVVRSVAIDVTTKMRKAPKTAEDERMSQLPAQDGEPMDGMIDAETREAVRDAVTKLPENEREAVIMCELQELPLRDACEVLGWSESRMKVTLYRARRRLRSMLGSYVGAGTVGS